MLEKVEEPLLEEDTAFSDELRISQKKHQSNFHPPGESGGLAARALLCATNTISDAISEAVVDAYVEEEKKKKVLDRKYWKTINMRSKTKPRSK